MATGPAREQMLDFLGLSATDRLAYALWLRHPAWDACRVAGELGRSEAEVAGSRKRLLDQGLLAPHPSEPDSVLPVGPETIVECRIAEIEADAARQRAAATRARAELSALVTAHLVDRGDAPRQEIERIDDAATVGLRLEGLVRAARHEMLALHTAGAPQPEALGACQSLDRRTLQRGVAMRAVYPHGLVTEATCLRYLECVSGEGARIRTAARLPLWLKVIDGEIGIVPASEDGRSGCLVIRGSGVVTAFQALFERFWEHAQPLKLNGPDGAAACPPAAGELSERDQRLLQLLGLGIKDEAVARHLGVSVRTVRRQISALCGRLEVTSRFQAGAQAAQRGWL